MNNLDSKLFQKNVISSEEKILVKGGFTSYTVSPITRLSSNMGVLTNPKTDCDCETATSVKDASEPHGGCGDIVSNGETTWIYY